MNKKVCSCGQGLNPNQDICPECGRNFITGGFPPMFGSVTKNSATTIGSNSETTVHYQASSPEWWIEFGAE